MPLNVNVSEGTRAALQADLTLRVLLKTKYDNEDRHSRVVIAWATSRAEKFTQATLESFQQPASSFTVEVKMIQLLGLHDRALICFDMFLDGCEASVHRQDEQSLVGPVHVAVHRGKAYFLHRSDKKLETSVTQRWNRFRELDKGPLPYFSDLKHPPVYDRGRRIERPGMVIYYGERDANGRLILGPQSDGKKTEGQDEVAGHSNEETQSRHEKADGIEEQAEAFHGTTDRNDSEAKLYHGKADDMDGQAKGGHREADDIDGQTEAYHGKADCDMVQLQGQQAS